MTPEAREEVHKTTAFLLKRAQPLIQFNYLVQQAAIAESYAKAIYESVAFLLCFGHELTFF